MRNDILYWICLGVFVALVVTAIVGLGIKK